MYPLGTHVVHAGCGTRRIQTWPNLAHIFRTVSNGLCALDSATALRTDLPHPLQMFQLLSFAAQTPCSRWLPLSRPEASRSSRGVRDVDGTLIFHLPFSPPFPPRPPKRQTTQTPHPSCFAEDGRDGCSVSGADGVVCYFACTQRRLRHPKCEVKQYEADTLILMRQKPVGEVYEAIPTVASVLGTAHGSF